MNNKGFMMAEVVVVSAIVLTLLGSIYASYNKLYSLYSTRIDYYDAVTLYKLAYYRDCLIEEAKINLAITNLKKTNDPTKNFLDVASIQGITVDETDRVFLVYNHKEALTQEVAAKIKEKNINATFKDYIDYLHTSDELFKNNKSNFVMIMERCNYYPNKEYKRDNINLNDCKYAYLEVFDGTERP